MQSTIRIFVSSPNDVFEERQIVGKVIAQLQGKYWSFVRLEDVFWESATVRATAHYQDEIVNPGECDIVLGILWSRLGSSLPEKFNNEENLPRTGTEWELEEAFSAHKNGSGQKPDIVVYRRESIRPPFDDPASEAEAASQEADLEEYLHTHFFHEDGTIKRPMRGYESLGAFEELLRRNLEELILKLIPGLKAGYEPPPISGCPFKGLDAFDFHDQDRYFGRTRESREVQELLRESRKGGSAFILVYGASGYGKSSLMRAGVAPLVTRQGGVVEEVSEWRRVLFQPAQGEGPLLERLARVMLAPPSASDLVARELDSEFPLSGIGELAGWPNRFSEDISMEKGRSTSDELMSVWDLANVARYLGDDENLVFLVAAIEEWLEEEGKNLLLQFDQLEEVFDERFDGERGAFFRAIQALCCSPRIWGVGTMRSEFFPRIAETTSFQSLVREGGDYTLPPPTVQMLNDVIRFPALAARLNFERRIGPVEIAGAPVMAETLDAQIFEEAKDNLDALPLLEFCLTELYRDTLPEADDLEGERGTDVLTWESYRRIGGLKGAIASVAEETFRELRETERTDTALAKLFGSLVRVDSESATATRARANMDQLRNDPHIQPILDALLKRRLLVADESEDTDGSEVYFVHDSLLTHWNELRNWIDQHRADLVAQQRLKLQSLQWDSASRPKDLLLLEGRLAEAQRVASSELFLVTELQEEFLSRSEKRAGRRLRFVQLAAIAFACLAGVAIVFAVLSDRDRNRATRETERAELALDQVKEEKANAEAARNLAVEQKEQAESAREAADKVIKTITYDLRDELLDRGMTAILDRVSSIAADYYVSYGEDFSDDRSRRDYAAALVNQAQAKEDLGEFDEAIELVQEAIGIFIELRDKHPDGWMVNLDISAARQTLASIATMSGSDDDLALEQVQLSKGIEKDNYERWDRPENADRYHLVLNLVGSISSSADHHEEAYEAFLEAYELAIKIYKRAPIDVHAYQIGTSASGLGNACYDLERYDEAENYLLEATRRLRSVRKEDRDFSWSAYLASALQRLGQTLAKLDRSSEAMPYLLENYEMYRAFHSAESSETNLMWVGKSSLIVAEQLRKTGREKEALQKYRESIDAFFELVTTGAKIEYSGKFMTALRGALSSRTESKDGHLEFAYVLDVKDRLESSEFRSESLKNLSLAQCWGVLADHYRKLDDFKSLIDCDEKTLQLFSREHARLPTRLKKKNVAVSLSRLGEWCALYAESEESGLDENAQLEQLARSQAHFARGIEVVSELMAEDGEDGEMQRKLNQLYSELDQTSRAIAKRGDAEALARAFTDDPASSDTFLPFLWRLRMFADYKKSIRDVDGQLQTREQIVSIWREAFKSGNPVCARASAKTAFAGELGRLAYAKLYAREYAGALSTVEESLLEDDSQLWILALKAHCLLFLGNWDAAKEIYDSNRGRNLFERKDSIVWEQAIFSAFATFREYGLPSDEMERATQLLR